MILDKAALVTSFRYLPYLMRSFFLVGAALLFTGCGESQEDRIMRAARRHRTPDVEPAPSPEATVAAVELPPEPEAPADAEMPQLESVEADEAANVAVDGEPAVVKSIEPVEKRKPADPLSDDDRRRRAVDNLEKIAAAINKYVEKNGAYPPTYMTSSGGIKTLSWRVLILPYLGYPELYAKFNPNEPWNGINNRKLLDLIPDEFVSPERFDTKTNYHVPNDIGTLFGGTRVEPSAVTDGIENTILLVEVDDDRAVPWTQPVDTVGMDRDLKANIGDLRGDGTFAIWGNGWPVLLSNELPWLSIAKALSFESGDGQSAGMIHRDISIGEVSKASIATTTPGPAPYVSAAAPPTEPVIVRDPLPNQASLDKAAKRLREVFDAKLKAAIDDKSRIALANELLQRADEISEDPASVYVLIDAAIKLATAAGDIETALLGIDMRITRIDVDAFKENMSMLLSFGNDNMNRSPGEIDGMIYLQRSIKTIYSSVVDNDYASAGKLAGYCYRFVDQPRNGKIPKSLNSLRVLLSSVNRQYETAKDSLADFRDNPEDGEAAANFGKFLCFAKGDWDNGLPLLAKGGPVQLREMAAYDLAGASDTADFVKLGDSWWSLAELARTPLYRQGAIDRAAYWYQQAYGLLPESLDKIHVKARLDELQTVERSSPLSIISAIAEDSDVDLQVSLAAIAAVGGSRRTRADDAEN